MIDASRNHAAMAGGDDEVAAYLAQAIYSLNAGDALIETGPLAGPVHQVARKIKNFAGPGIYVVNPDEIAGAKPLILARFAGIARAQAAPTDVIVQSVAPPSVPIVPE